MLLKGRSLHEQLPPNELHDASTPSTNCSQSEDHSNTLQDFSVSDFVIIFGISKIKKEEADKHAVDQPPTKPQAGRKDEKRDTEKKKKKKNKTIEQLNFLEKRS